MSLHQVSHSSDISEATITSKCVLGKSVWKSIYQDERDDIPVSLLDDIFAIHEKYAR